MSAITGQGAIVLAILLPVLAAPAAAATFAPEAIEPSTLTLRAEEVPTPFDTNRFNNLRSPAAIDGRLHFVDQRGRVIVETVTGFQTVLDLSDPADRPAGFDPDPLIAIHNVAGAPGGDVYVSTTSLALPAGAPAASPLPATGDYAAPRYQVIYRYERAPDGTLTNPTALASFETGEGHQGGALLSLDGGGVLYTTGDSQPFGLDGRAAPQDPSSHLSAIHRIGDDGSVELLAKGLRNVQRLTYADADRSTVAFADIGAAVAEEVDVVPLADLLDTSTIENFGWGRNPDGLAREGTFYIGPGAPRASGQPAPVGAAPTPEPGFLQPYAQWGREDLAFAAITGPVFSPGSFDRILALFGDLPGGMLLATTAPLDGGGLADVFEVNLVDAAGLPTTLLDLSEGTGRADPRFFNFADGGAGVLLERAGRAFRLTEVSVATVPVPALGWAFAALLAGMGLRGRRARNA